MSKYYRISIFYFQATFCFFAGIPYALCQEQLGLRLENYSGISGVKLNPGSSASYPLRWDINLAGMNFFAENNYAYVSNSNLFELWGKRENTAIVPDFENPNSIPLNAARIDFPRTFKDKSISGIIGISGPSALVHTDNGHSFGVFTEARMAAGGHNLPFFIGWYEYEEMPFYDTVFLHPFRAVFSSWLETGAHYSYKIPTDDGFLSVGANLKWLHGYESGYFALLNDAIIAELPDDTIRVFSNGQYEYGYTTSNLSLSADNPNIRPRRNGGGIAVDIGAVLTGGGDEEEYRWKAGISLLDIGSIRYNRNSKQHLLTIDSTAEVWRPEVTGLSYPSETEYAVQILSDRVLEDSFATLSNNAFTVWSPTAISIQGEFAFNNHVFINGTLVQRIPIGNISIERENIFALTPRYEHRAYSASLPIVLHEWKDIRFGAAVRLGFLTVGTEHIPSFFLKENLTGTDFYVALKVTPFDLHWIFGGDKKPRRWGGKGERYNGKGGVILKKKSNVRCPHF